MDDEYDHDQEIPNHHLPCMSDLPNHPSSGHHTPRMVNLDNPSGHHHPHPMMADHHSASGHQQNKHHPHPKMTDHENPSGHHHHNGPPPSHHHNGGPPPLQYPNQYPSPLPPPAIKHNRRPPHSPPYDRHRQPSKAGAFATIATLLLLAALTALILYLVYRPKTPHFTIVAASIYLLNSTTPTITTTPTASFLAATLQFTVVTRNPSRHTSLYYDHLTAQVFYRDQPITQPSDLPPLHHSHRTTVVFSPVLGGGEAVPVAPGVTEGLDADETYGMLGLKLALMGRVRYKAGIIKTAHYGVYVGCDVLVGVKKAAVGPVPLLANHDCKVDM